jgi:predicted metal-dependent hydrolase
MVIRSVRRYAGQITDPHLKKRVTGLVGQELVHSQEHDRLNMMVADKGYLNVKILNYANKFLPKYSAKLEAQLPGLIGLAVSAGIEHYTAVLSEKLLSDPDFRAIPGDPEVWNLLEWHAYEELEHKSVAFDVYREFGGPEWLRRFIFLTMYVGSIPGFTAWVLLSVATDPSGWKPRQVARETVGILRGPLVKGTMSKLAVYFRRGFHPDDVDTSALLDTWAVELFGPHGTLLDRVK